MYELLKHAYMNINKLNQKNRDVWTEALYL